MSGDLSQDEAQRLGQVAQSAWHEGFAAGESDICADWDMALEDVLPDDVQAKPSGVAAYIERLQRALYRAVSEPEDDPAALGVTLDHAAGTAQLLATEPYEEAP